MIITSEATTRLTLRLMRAGLRQWVGEVVPPDKQGKYLRFQVGGPCLGGLGRSLKQATERVEHLIRSLNHA